VNNILVPINLKFYVLNACTILILTADMQNSNEDTRLLLVTFLVVCKLFKEFNPPFIPPLEKGGKRGVSVERNLHTKGNASLLLKYKSVLNIKIKLI